MTRPADFLCFGDPTRPDPNRSDPRMNQTRGQLCIKYESTLLVRVWLTLVFVFSELSVNCRIHSVRRDTIAASRQAV